MKHAIMAALVTGIFVVAFFAASAASDYMLYIRVPSVIAAMVFAAIGVATHSAMMVCWLAVYRGNNK